MSAGTMEYNLTMTGGSQFAAGLKSAASQATELAGTLKGKLIGGIAAVGAALGGGLSISWFANGIRSALDAGSALNLLSQRTNETAENLLKIERVSKDSDISLEAMGSMANRLQGALSGVSEMGESTAESFAALGVSQSKLSGMSYIQQLQAIGAGLEKLGKHEDKVKILKNLFGKEGASLMPFFADADKLGAPLSAGAALLAKNAALFNKVGDSLGRTGEVVKGFFYGAADRVAPLLLPLLDRFNKIDLSSYGQQIGNVFSIIATAFKNGKLADLAGLSLKVGFMTAVEFFASSMMGTLTMFAGALVPTIGMVGRLLTDPKLWNGLAVGAEAAVARLGSALLGAFREPLSWLSATFELIAQKLGAAIVAIWNPIARVLGMGQLEVKDKRSFEQMRQDYITQSKDAENRISGIGKKDQTEAGRELGDAVSARLADVKSIIGKAMEDFKNGSSNVSLFGDSLTDARKKLDTLTAGLTTNAAKTGAATSLANAGAAAATDSGRKPNADSWAKIGFIVGGGGGQTAATKAAEKTARHSEETVRQLQIIATKLSNPSSGSTATYA